MERTTPTLEQQLKAALTFEQCEMVDALCDSKLRILLDRVITITTSITKSMEEDARVQDKKYNDLLDKYNALKSSPLMQPLTTMVFNEPPTTARNQLASLTQLNTPQQRLLNFVNNEFHKDAGKR